MSVPTFYVTGIIAAVGQKYGVNIGCDFADDSDLCYGLVVTNLQTVTQFLTKHAPLYNYLLLDDIINGVPVIRCIQRATNSDLTIDAEINQADCVFANDGSPVIQFTRTDPMSLPRQVELQYTSFDRGYAVNTQYARNDGAKSQQGTLSIQSDFILSDAVARELAYDLLFRMWSQRLTLSFTHPDLTIEPSDIVQVTTDQGTFTIQVLSSMITKEPMNSSGSGRVNQLTGQTLLTRRGVTVAAGQISTVSGLGVGLVKSVSTVAGVAENSDAVGTVIAQSTVSGRT